MMRSIKVAGKAGGICTLLTLWAVAVLSCAAAKEPDAAAKSETVRLLVPNAAWHLKIERIFELDREVWLLLRAERTETAAAQQIVTAEVPVPVPLPDKPRQVFVVGKTWAWKNDEPYDFTKSTKSVIQEAGNARVLFSAEP